RADLRDRFHDRDDVTGGRLDRGRGVSRLLLLVRLLERGIGAYRGPECRRRRAVVAAIERVEPRAVREEGGEVLRTLPQDPLPLCLRQLNPELCREAEYQLLLEVEQLLECAVRLRT